MTLLLLHTISFWLGSEKGEGGPKTNVLSSYAIVPLLVLHEVEEEEEEEEEKKVHNSQRLNIRTTS